MDLRTTEHVVASCRRTLALCNSARNAQEQALREDLEDRFYEVLKGKSSDEHKWRKRAERRSAEIEFEWLPRNDSGFFWENGKDILGEDELKELGIPEKPI